jgi:hypothetical protein
MAVNFLQLRGAKRLQRNAPDFYDPAVLYVDFLIYDRTKPTIPIPNPPPPDPATQAPNGMITLCRVDGVVWVASYAVTTTIVGDQLMNNNNLFCLGLSQLIDIRSAGEAAFFIVGPRFYIIRFRVGTLEFNQSSLLEIPAPPDFELDVLPFIYSSSIIRYTIDYTINDVTRPSTLITINRKAPNFYDQGVLYSDILIYDTPGGGGIPNPGTVAPNNMITICRVNGTLWFASYAVVSTIVGDDLLNQNSIV